MSLLRTVILSVLGFSIPVILALICANLAFTTQNPQLAARAAANLTSGVVAEGPGEQMPDISSSTDLRSSFARVPSDASLDPQLDETFVVSLLVLFDRLPASGKRNNVISKYDWAASPYSGWALGVHRLATSLRPEVYWRGQNGSGGWLTFDGFQFSTLKWYAFTTVVVPRGSVSLFIQEMQPAYQGSEVIPASEDRQGRTFVASGPVVFVGGYDLAAIEVPQTTADLLLGARKAGSKSFLGKVGHVLVARTGRLNCQVPELLRTLDGGPFALKSFLDEKEVMLWIAESGHDESRFARVIEITGHGEESES